MMEEDFMFLEELIIKENNMKYDENWKKKLKIKIKLFLIILNQSLKNYFIIF